MEKVVPSLNVLFVRPSKAHAFIRYPSPIQHIRFDLPFFVLERCSGQTDPSFGGRKYCKLCF
ncbi:hypothetical protein Patl1_37653 [Pistacia atlantica]|nr:hypothetical protein Patl1_37653 [Pistacia atlantica]